MFASKLAILSRLLGDSAMQSKAEANEVEAQRTECARGVTRNARAATP